MLRSLLLVPKESFSRHRRLSSVVTTRRADGAHTAGAATLSENCSRMLHRRSCCRCSSCCVVDVNVAVVPQGALSSSERSIIPLQHQQSHARGGAKVSLISAPSWNRYPQPQHVSTWKNHTSQQSRRYKSVFVSKHNQSLNITSRDVLDYCESHGLTPRGSSDYRITASHVILKECPFCTNINDKADNMYKIYISNTTGAYFCHRCGTGGSWFDWKLKISGQLGLTVDPDFYGQQQQSSSSPSSQHTSYHTASKSSTNHSSRSSYERNPRERFSGPSGSGRSTATAGRNGSSTTSSTSTVQPLPMPSPRLQALYSTQLLDSGNDGGVSSNRVLDYLNATRGLSASTLRKYGVGQATYAFANEHSAWIKADCVTFPWMMSVADAEYQESLRGSAFVWDGAEAAQAAIAMAMTTADQGALDAESTAGSSNSNTNTSTDNAVDETSDSLQPAMEMTIASPADTKAIEEDDDDDEEEPVMPRTLQEVKEQTFLTRRIKVRSVDRKEWQRMDPPGGGWGLFGFHTVPADATELVITEGEYDAMAVYQATGRPAVSLPNGCRSLPVEVLPLLEDFAKVILWMDNDAAGQEGAEQFAKKIGLERTFLVRPTVSNCRRKIVVEGEKIKPDTFPKDANEALLQGIDLERMIADAKLVPHERIVQFADLRSDVLHEIMHPDKYVGVPVTSLPGLTKIIKGLRRGELTVLTGPTGSGKTTFLGQMSLDLVEQDVNVLWGSFEIKNTRLMHKLLQQFAREPLPAGDPTMAHKLEALADRFERLPFSFMKFHGGSDVDDVLDAMDYAVYVNDVEHIILDNMQFMVSLKNLGKGSTFDKFDVQDVAIEKFRKFATDRNVHVTLVVHPKKEAEFASLSISSIYGSAKATQEADTVLILQNDGRRKFLEVKKNRFNGDLGHTPLHFDRHSCRYGETPILDVKSSSGSSSSGGGNSMDYRAGGSGGGCSNGGYKSRSTNSTVNQVPAEDPWAKFFQ